MVSIVPPTGKFHHSIHNNNVSIFFATFASNLLKVCRSTNFHILLIEEEEEDLEWLSWVFVPA
jgi:hypothetical protein